MMAVDEAEPCYQAGESGIPASTESGMNAIIAS